MRSTPDFSRRTLVRGAFATGAAASLASLGGVLRVAPAAARQATPAAASGPNPAQRFQVGQISVVVLDDGSLAGPAPFFAVNAAEAEIAEVMAAQGLTPADTFQLGIHPLLVETGDQRILLDTGNGATAETPGLLLSSLQAEGIAPEEIDIVLISHMHSDHFGGAIDPVSGKPLFPNAQYLLNSAEQEFWASDPGLGELIVPDEFKAMFLPPILATMEALSPVLELINPGDEIAPGVTAIDARGHTPGHLAVEISSNGEGMLHIVDAAHVAALHLTHPGWFMIADNWPAWSVTSRKALFDRAADENLLVATYHFPFPGVGRVTKDEIGWVWTDETGS